MFGLLNSSTESNSYSQIPERELLLAVLDRCVLDYHGSNPKLKLAADEWLFGEGGENEDVEFSFDWICEFLGFEQEALRDCIRALEFRGKSPQGHRWLRSKIKSSELAYA